MSGRDIVHQLPTTSSMQSDADALFDELLRIGDDLLAKDPDLFKTAVARLQSKVPREPSPVRRAAGAEQKGVKGEGVRRASTAFPKYRLPKGMAEKEFYQCMTCNERRPTNSFHADHQHEEKFTVRWYCPICKLFFAVTHRGYHIRKRHTPASSTKDPDRKSRSLSPIREDPYSPESKRSHMDDSGSDTTVECSYDERKGNIVMPMTTPAPPPPIPVMPMPAPGTTPPAPVRLTDTNASGTVPSSGMPLGVGPAPSEDIGGNLIHSVTSELLPDFGPALSSSGMNDPSLFPSDGSAKGGRLFPGHEGAIIRPK